MTRHAAATASDDLESTHDEGVILTEYVLGGHYCEGPFIGANVSRMPSKRNTGKLDLYFSAESGILKRTYHFLDVLDVEMGLLRFALALGWQGRIVWGL
jgi:hypothetical protein